MYPSTSPSTNGYLNSPTSPPPRVPPPPPTQENTSMDITLTLSPITPLDGFQSSNNSETDSEISLSVFDVRSSDEESTPVNDMLSKADGYHVVPLPITGNFLTPRADISFASLDEYAIRKKIIK
ncbi:hypothetical protein Tco_1256049 [Tanacetum coccineum]